MSDFSMSINAMTHSTQSLYKARIVDNIIVEGGDEPKPTIQGMSFFKCIIVTSILKNCALFNCTILSCTITNSKLINCIIRRDIPLTHTRKPSILCNCWTTGCLITKSIISRKSKVEGGELASCEIQNSTIGKALVCETSILSCTINSCILIVSKQHGCKMLRTSKSGCKAVFTLRVFPAELRSIIFEYSMERFGLLPKHMPALIPALRPDPQLYHEALYILYNKSCFIAGMSNVLTISNSKAQYVRRLVLSKVVGINGLPLHRFFQSAKSLRELHFYNDNAFDTLVALKSFRNCLFDIPMVEKLSVSYNPNWIRQNVDEDKLFVRSLLFNQNAQITHMERTSESEKTQSWSVEKGGRLLREAAHTL